MCISAPEFEKLEARLTAIENLVARPWYTRWGLKEWASIVMLAIGMIAGYVNLQRDVREMTHAVEAMATRTELDAIGATAAKNTDAIDALRDALSQIGADVSYIRGAMDRRENR